MRPGHKPASGFLEQKPRPTILRETIDFVSVLGKVLPARLVSPKIPLNFLRVTDLRAASFTVAGVFAQRILEEIASLQYKFPKPLSKPIPNAATVLEIAKGIPRMADVRMNIDGSMIGEARQNAITGASGSPMAIRGTTPQEQNGDTAL